MDTLTFLQLVTLIFSFGILVESLTLIKDRYFTYKIPALTVTGSIFLFYFIALYLKFFSLPMNTQVFQFWSIVIRLQTLAVVLFYILLFRYLSKRNIRL